MNKAEMNAVKARIDNIVWCTCGAVSGKINMSRVSIPEYTAKEMYEMVANGKAKLKGFKTLKDEYTPNGTMLNKLVCSYTYPGHPKAAEALAAKKILDSRQSELHGEIINAGERLYDKIILQVISPVDVVKVLEDISNMSSAA